jgi:transketolase
LYAGWSGCDRGERIEVNWQRLFERYRENFPELADEFERRLAGRLPEAWNKTADAFARETLAGQTAMATRQASCNALNRYAQLLPELIGGSADLTPANKTNWKGSTPVRWGQPHGNHVNYGARELAMGSILAGLARHGGFIPFGGTFLMFCEYARHAMWLAGIQRVPCIFQFTHDSIGLGEDGPTHQPIEQLASLRLIPGMVLWRPCDPVESALAWRAAIERRDGPSCLVFTRQTVPLPTRDSGSERNIHRGGYILRDCKGTPEVIIIATGSEVPVATQAADTLNARGHRVRVVSMPCTQVFDAQDADYRESVLPAGVNARVVVEAGSTHGWHRYAGPQGQLLGIDDFGVSAPQEILFEYFGFTETRVIEAAEAAINGASN